MPQTWPVENPDIRWKQRLESFGQALEELTEAVDLARTRTLSKIERQGLIQAFEFTHELAWKTLKDLLQERGAIYVMGSKDATREAFAAGLIDDGAVWMDMIKDRNRTTHTYNVTTATAIAEVVVSTYHGSLEKLHAKLQKL